MIKLNNSIVYLNGKDITSEVFSLAVNDAPGEIPTATITLALQRLDTVKPYGERPTFYYHLGSERDDKHRG